MIAEQFALRKTQTNDDKDQKKDNRTKRNTYT